MTDVDPSIIERSVEKTHIWLNEPAEELGVEDRQYAYRALRAVLHVWTEFYVEHFGPKASVYGSDLLFPLTHQRRSGVCA